MIIVCYAEITIIPDLYKNHIDYLTNEGTFLLYHLDRCRFSSF